MLTFRRLISLVVPSSILGLSWFWWRWKSKVYLKPAIESGTVEGSDPVNDNDIGKTDTISNIVTEVDITKTVFHKVGDENLIGTYNTDEPLVNMDNNDMECVRSLDNCPPEMSSSNIDININNDIINENTIKSITLGEDLSVPPSVDEKNSNNKLTVLQSDTSDYNNIKECEKEVEEDEISLLMVNPNGCEILPFENSESDVILPDRRSNSIISQLSVDCVQEDLDCGEFSPVNYNTSTIISGKRLRNRSSCGDSAIVEDYSSDALSITGSDSAIKSSEGEVCTLECKPLAEEQCFKKGFYPQENGRNYRDWYGSTLGSANFKERPEKPRHWGSVPVTDSDSDSECILKRTAKIGSVSLDKLSIQLNEELSNIKSGEKISSAKSPRYPKQNRRRNRKSESSRPPKKTVNPKQSPQPKKNDSSRKQRKRSNSSPKKDIDKPWRNHEAGKKCEKVTNVNAKRETIEYEFPDDMCGRLIGKSGRHISEFKETTGVDICIECELRGKNRVVSMTGVLNQIKTAEKLLNEKFHDSLKLASYPKILEVENNISPITLPENTEIEVIVTAIVDVGNFYVQVFHRDVDEKIMQLQTELSGCYVTPRQKYIYLEKDLPKVDEYCVSFIDNVWCRLKILEVFSETRMVDAFFIDYGGNINLSIDLIWKIRPDMLQTPSQAVLCCLNNVVPVEGDIDFSYGANDIFYQLVGGKVLQAFVVSTEDEVPSVRLSCFDDERGEMFSVSEQMQLWGLAQDQSIPQFVESLQDESIPQFVESLQDESTLKYVRPLQGDSTPLFVESILNGSAPQFICAS